MNGIRATPSVPVFGPVRLARAAWERSEPQLFFELQDLSETPIPPGGLLLSPGGLSPAAPIGADPTVPLAVRGISGGRGGSVPTTKGRGL